MVDSPEGVLIIDCVEYSHIDIDASLWLGEEHRTNFNSEIDGRDILRANFKKGFLRLQATSYVGVIPINERVVVRVRPRVPIANLTRMVVDTGHSVLPLSTFREYSGRGTVDDWAMKIYADALLDYVDEILDFGMMRAYERCEGEGHYPRGRIEFTRTTQRFASKGVTNKAAYAWYERTVDTSENRCVKAAMEVVYEYLRSAKFKPQRGDRAKLARLVGQLHSFEDVGDDPDFGFLNEPGVLGIAPLPDSRYYYRKALDLSLLILQGIGLALEIGGEDVRLTSLLIDTNKLFENFIRVSLANHAQQHGWPVEVIDGNTEHGRVDLYDVPDPLPAPLGVPMAKALASQDSGKAQPDVVLKTPNGGFPLIAEVKNTTHGMTSGADTLPDRGEVEQAVTYALRYDLPFTLLIHPWSGGTKGLVYVGRVHSIDVYDFRLDLSSDENLDSALASMADAVAALAQISSNQAPRSG